MYFIYIFLSIALCNNLFVECIYALKIGVLLIDQVKYLLFWTRWYRAILLMTMIFFYLNVTCFNIMQVANILLAIE